MTVASANVRVTATGNGAATSFSYPYYVIAAADLKVYVNGALQTLTTHYTLSGTAPYTNGTNVQFVTAPATGLQVILVRDPPQTQLTAYVENDPFPVATVEQALDKLTMLAHTTRDTGSRALRLSQSDSRDGANFELSAPANWTNKYLLFDANGNPTPAVLSATTITQAIIGGLLNPQTPAESGAGVVPITLAVVPGERARYSTLADAVAVCAAHALQIRASEQITASITLPAGAKIQGHNSPLITCSTAGVHVFNGTSLAAVTIDGVRFKGANSTTTPGTGYGGYAAANTGLVTLTSCTDVRVTNCEFDTFYNGLTAQNCARLFVKYNRCRSFRVHGILASSSTQFAIDENIITDCTQAGAAVAYGIHATGDEAGGNTQQQCSISFNTIDGVPSWSGVMSHDVTGLRVIGNDIRNVRNGIDVGHLVATNELRNIIISGNYIKSTATDTWSTTAAAHFGIGVVGFNATDRVLGAVISDNIVDGFFATAGMVAAGLPSHIVVSDADDVTVTGNIVKNGGSVISNAGVYMVNTVNRISVSGNTLQGTMAQGGIRGQNAVSDVMAVNGNVIKQTTVSHSGIEFLGSTVSALSREGNSTNSTVPFLQATSTITFSGDLEGSATYDPPSLADGAGATTTIAVTGAALGDFAIASFGGDIANVTITAYVSAAGTVSVRLQNESGGTVDLGSSTLRVRVLKRLGT